MPKTIKDEQGNVYKIKKPFYKKWYFILFVLLILFTIGGSFGSKKSDTKKSDKQEQAKKNNPVKVDGNKKEEVVEKIIRLSAFTNYNFKKDSDTNNYAKAIGIVRNEDEIGSEIIKMFNLEDLGILETLIAVFILKYSINEIYRLVVDKIEKLNKLKGDLWNEIILEKDSYTNMEIANLIASYENEKDINKINNNIRKMLSNQPVLSYCRWRHEFLTRFLWARGVV